MCFVLCQKTAPVVQAFFFAESAVTGVGYLNMLEQ
jgi:hypothetical protein